MSSDKAFDAAREVLTCIGAGATRYSGADIELGAQIIRKAFPEQVAEDDVIRREMIGLRADLKATTDLLRESVLREEARRQEIEKLRKQLFRALD